MSRRGQDIRVWSVQDRRGAKGYSKRPWLVRWRVQDTNFQRPFRTVKEADHFRSELLTAQRDGGGFDLTTGLPAAWADGQRIAMHDWVRRWLSEQWDEWQPRTRNGTVEEMSRLVPLLIRPTASPPPTDIRLYLKDALRPDAELDTKAERWMGRWCYTLDELDRSILSEVDRQLGIGVDGRILSPTTALRYRKAARACIRRAVDLDLIERNPWPPAARGARNRKARRKARERSVEIRRLPDPPTMHRALEAMRNHHPASEMYYVMTSVLAYAGLRPSEVVMLRVQALQLPAEGWGKIEVSEADISFDESGEPKTGDRTVPIPATLVAVLRQWLDIHDFQPEDLIFRTREDNRPSPSNWRRAWHLALSKIGHEALRPYDCRHTAATTWLHAGVPLGETARRLGHSVETLVATYVGALNGDETVANDLIDSYMGRATANQGGP